MNKEQIECDLRVGDYPFGRKIAKTLIDSNVPYLTDYEGKSPAH